MDPRNNYINHYNYLLPKPKFYNKVLILSLNPVNYVHAKLLNLFVS